MKRIIASLILTTITAGIFAQSPEIMSYQAVVRNSNSQLVTNQTVGMRISILQGTATGTAVYVETQIPTSNENGLITVEIGGGTVISGTFSAINWALGLYFLKTETDPTGGTNYTISGTSQLLSVPYALYSKTAGNGFSGNYDDIENKPDFTIWDKDSTDNVTLTGNQTIAGNKEFIGVVTIKTPINNTDAVNKDYVDALKNQVEAMNNIMLNAGYNGTLIDVEGNVYKTVKIGTQIWMAENLKTKKYNDGSAIPNITEDTTWINLTTGAYCWYENNEAIYQKVYGALYNWYAVVDDHNLCPTGWHIPTTPDYSALYDYLTSFGTDGIFPNQMMKDTSSGTWAFPCTADDAGTNSSGFSGLPAGIRVGLNPYFAPFNTGKFRYLHQYGFFWLYEGDFICLTYCSMLSLVNELFYDQSKADGYSVRCVKD